MSRMNVTACACCVTLFLLFFARHATAEPVIRNLSVRGLQAGATTTLTVDGTDLLPNPKLMLNLPIAEQKLLEGATANRVQFEVTLDANTTPGLYNLRVANQSGISAAQIISIDRFSQIPFAERAEQLPCSMHGVVSGSTVLKTRLVGKAGQLLMVEVEAQRLGSALRPVLHLRDANNKQLAYSWASHSLAGDARLIIKLPADGEYTIELHDTLYAVPGQGFFRLKLGEWKCADLAFPAAVQKGSDTEILLLGEDLESKPTQMTFAQSGSWQPVPWPEFGAENQLVSGWRPKVLVTDQLELQEAPSTADTLQELSLAPVAINGRLQNPGEEDKYRLSLTPGAKVRLETFAQRLGAQVDTEIELQDDQGKRLALNDDGAGTNSADSLLEYTPAVDVSSVIVVIRDVHRRGNDASIYRLEVTPLDEPAAPDFRLILADDRQQITAGSHAVLPVMVERNGYDGAIRIVADGLPNGVELLDNVIPAGMTGTLLTLKGVSPENSQVISRLRGEAIDLPQPISRLAEFTSHSLSTWQPWLAQEIGLAVKPAEEQGLSVTWEEFAQDFTLPLGAKLEMPLQFSRDVADGGPIRVTLLTSQNPPMANNRPDLNKTLRQEQANLEVAVNPPAKAAADALAAAEKVLADAATKEQAAIDAATKANTTAEAAVKAASEKLAPIEKNLTDANAALKAAEETLAKAEEILKAAQAAVDTAASGTDEEKAKVATALATAQTELVAAKQTQAAAAQAAKVAMDAQAAAAKVLTDAQTAAASTKEAGKKSITAAKKVVTDATTKRDSAQAAADKAASEAKYESKVSVIVPGTLPEGPYDLAFKIELLTANKQQALNTVYTSVRTINTLNPLLVKLATEPKFTAEIDTAQGATVKLSGSIERRAGMKSVATVTLEGLPAGVPVPKATVAADKNEFELEIKFPANTKPGELENINLVANAKMEPGTGEVINSQPVPVRITLTSQTAEAADK